jgi:hypothetical protein
MASESCGETYAMWAFMDLPRSRVVIPALRYGWGNEKMKCLKKCIITMILTAILTVASFVCAFGASGQVAITIPNFSVSLNELKFDGNDYDPYPLLVYKDITYFPMTYYKSNLLNLNTSWTAEGGLVIKNSDSEMPKEFLYETPVSTRNNGIQTANIIDSKVTVNRKVIDNSDESYPLLSFRNVTYFPLTWRFAVEEFGWDYTFDNKAGLTIRADNFFYTANGDSSVDASGTSVSVVNETHYIKGDLWIHIKTDTNRLGPVRGNLHIIKSGIETRPDGYFGYFQKNGPLFSIDENYISTTYYIDPDARNPQPCRISVETGNLLTQ